MAGEECIIEVKGLHTRFGSHVVHEDINLCVRHGEVLGLVGGSGSGKTVLMRQMLGLDAPAEEEVRICGLPLLSHNPKELKDIRTRCGVLFQKGALFSALSVYKNIAQTFRELLPVD